MLRLKGLSITHRRRYEGQDRGQLWQAAGDIDGQEKATGGVCPDDGKSGQMAFQARADLQNQAIGCLPKGYGSLGGGTVVRFP